MTQSKLYYDDPLAAAWMAREFGVKYESGADGKPFIWPKEN